MYDVSWPVDFLGKIHAMYRLALRIPKTWLLISSPKSGIKDTTQ